jgi:broad specificity phosphatase PhoE
MNTTYRRPPPPPSHQSTCDAPSKLQRTMKEKSTIDVLYRKKTSERPKATTTAKGKKERKVIIIIMPLSSSSSSSSSSSFPSPSPLLPGGGAVVIVARHGERLDYVQRDDQGNGHHNWVQDHVNDAPYDPPLTAHGMQQASKLGRQLLHEVERLFGLSSSPNSTTITAVYSSPFLRCRQTAATIVREINTASSSSSSSSSTSNNDVNASSCCLKVKVEDGLAESINESWYRSWSLPDSDGTWGGFRSDEKDANKNILTDPSRLHPKSMIPIQSLLSEWKQNTTTTTDDTDDDDILLSNIDYTHESKTKIAQPYTLYPRFLESPNDQRRRMYQTVQTLKVPDQVIVLVSHGGPVTHLYEQMSDSTWHTAHGESTYCCYSIYQQEQQAPPTTTTTTTTTTTSTTTNTNKDDGDGNNNNNHGGWKALVVNESKYLHEELVTERHDQN